MIKGQLKLEEKLSDVKFEKILEQLPLNLPESYIAFVKKHNGAFGDLPVQPYYFQLWLFDDLVECNKDYEIQDFLPSYFGIGSNGGGELLAVNLENHKIFAIPFIPMEEEALLVANSFAEFEQMMGFSDESI